MASTLCSFHSLSRPRCFTTQRPRVSLFSLGGRASVVPPVAARQTFNVEILHEGETHVLDVKAGETVLEVALAKGLTLPHDCQLGVCMTCPAKLVSGEVDVGGSMLSEDVKAQGFTLLCQASPLTDCKIETIDEEAVLELQMSEHSDI